MPKKRIAVIGAGISGLVCAYELQKGGFGVTVFEKNNYVGGRISSRVREGLIFDIGADHLTNNYTQMHRYCEELGIDWIKMEFMNYCIFRQGKIYKGTDAISWWSKLKLGLQWLLTPKGLDYFDLSKSSRYDTETGYDYMKRRLGKEVADYFVNGYCAAYQFHLADEISKAGLIDTMSSLKYEADGWYLHHMKGGMKELPLALAGLLNVELGAEVEEVKSQLEQKETKVIIKTNQEEQQFDVVVMACTANVSRKIFVNPTEAQKGLLEAVQYAASISVCFRVGVEHLNDMASIVWVPFVENEKISAYVNETYKGEDCINEGKSMISVWLHQGWAEELMNKSDDEIYSLVKAEYLKVCPWFDNEGQLENWDLQRWPVAEPKFYQGYVTQVKTFLENDQGQGNVWLCGDYLNSPWAEGAVRCGQRVAEQIKSIS